MFFSPSWFGIDFIKCWRVADIAACLWVPCYNALESLISKCAYSGLLEDQTYFILDGKKKLQEVPQFNNLASLGVSFVLCSSCATCKEITDSICSAAGG